MGIRQKIMLGFFSLGMLLFFAGLMSYFELSRLSKSTKNLLDVSLKNIELSKTMLDAVQDQNTALLQMLVGEHKVYDTLLVSGRQAFNDALVNARVSIRDLNALDSIYAASERYNEVIDSHFRDSADNKNIGWFVQIYKTSYYDLTSSIKNFMVSSHKVMDMKTKQLERNAYRAIIPAVIALAIAVLIILMFFYMMDIYYIRPVLKMTQGLHNYLNSKIPFKVTMEGKDEVFKLKEYIETLVNQLKNKQN